MTDGAPAQTARYLQERSELIESALGELFASTASCPSNLEEVMRYAVFPGGKRFRPVLMLASAEALAAPPSTVLPAACALELIHCFSLVHDDLPCMDDDDERRGRPSSHRAFGVAEAMLAGNALIFMALRHALRAVPAGVSAGAAVEAVALICEASGHRGMIGGQYLELHEGHRELTPELLARVHALKTGALIRVAPVAAAVLCGAGEEERRALEKYGGQLGLAFQITDDILDHRAGSEQVSFVSVHGLEEARRLASVSVREALEAIESMGPCADNLRKMAVFLESRTF